MLPNHLIFEGPDKSGKTTLIEEVSYILRNNGYDILVRRNPSNPKLYQQMHEGILTHFQIAMSTLSDMLEDYEINIKPHLNSGGIVLQDRSALISAQVYNPMNEWERKLWFHGASEAYHTCYNNRNCKFIILTNPPFEEETNVFTNPINIIKYKELAQTGGEFSQTFTQFENIGTVNESAFSLLRGLGL